MKQEQAFDILKTGENVFLTGAPGSGKTYLLNKYINYLRKNDIPVAITASTGIASTHMNGRTIHSWSGIGIKEQLTDKLLRGIKSRNYIKKRIRKPQVLIIDEISMLHSYQFDMIDRICREVRGNARPFGGLQVVCSGDLFQLPPVQSRDGVGGRLAVESRSWSNMSIKTCYLDEQFRHKDNDLITVLKDIRDNSVTNKTAEILKSRENPEMNSDLVPTRLYTHNNAVNAVNNRELMKIHSPKHEFEMETKGNDSLVRSLKNSCLSPENLVLKEGAKVMFTKNDFDRGYVNGTMGEVVDFDEDGYPVVKLRDGGEVVAFPDTWRIEDEHGKAQAKVTQVPLRLAWAITIHKSQGMTLDSAEIDLSRSFEEGMGYVALSRVRSLQHLHLRGFNDTALQVSDKALTFDEYFRSDSEKSKDFITNFDDSYKEKIHEQFLNDNN